ncbi:MAG: 2-thiouracil desulfurase family protein [Bacteroidia bacterium]
MINSSKPRLSHIRTASVEDPLRLLVSACMTGVSCAYDPTASTRFDSVDRILESPLVKISTFCPEHFSFGTPRELCDIHGGTGLDVLEGRAKVLTESGRDWTDGMISASEKMLELALKDKVELAVLLDISAACGSQVVYGGSRKSTGTPYLAGAGVCAAQLIRNGISVISARFQRLFNWCIRQ